MKTLTMIFAAALTLMATTSHAVTVLPCGKIYSGSGPRLTENKHNAATALTYQDLQQIPSARARAVNSKY